MLDDRGSRRAPAVSPTADAASTSDFVFDQPNIPAKRGAAAKNTSIASNASVDLALRQAPTVVAPKKTTTSARGGPGSRGGRGRPARGAATKTDLNISVAQAPPRASRAVQPSIQTSFASQSTRPSQRNATALSKAVASRQVTQYISDSDSD